MPKILARQRALAPALIATVFAVLCMWPGAASAGTYDVSSCTPDGSVSGWTVYGSPSVVEGMVCPANGFAVANAPNIGVIGSTGGGLRFKAPAGTSLVGIGSGLRVQRMDSSYWLGLIAASGQLLFGYWANDGTPTPSSSSTPSAWFPLNHESDVHLEVGCASLCDTAVMGSPGYRAWLQAFAPMTIRIEDNGAPSVAVTGGSLVGSTYATGTQAITFDASDASGIRVTRLYVDGSKLRDDTGSCNFEQPVPCSNVSGGSYALDTNALTDGSHVVKVEVVDAAGNVSAQTRTVTVDNHAPAAPAVSAGGGEGWRSSNGFSVSWAIPAGQVAPVAKAHYLICRADQPGDCQPAGVQSGTNISSLSGLTVPAEGDYTLTVWLEDAAGNTSVANASAPVHLRYDATAPARVSNLTVAGGQGWRSANSFDLSWTDPAGQGAPITSARYRLCDEGGTCTSGVQTGSAGMNSLSGLHVPGPGAYSLTLWVGDEAGNADPSTASSAVELRFDDTDPGEAQPEPSDGWLGAAGAAGGYDEAIHSAASPPSGIAGYAVTLDGSEPGVVSNTGADGVFHITDVPEGAVTVKARAISGAGVASSHVGSAVLRVDETAPEVSASGAPDSDAWLPQAVTVELHGSDELSGMEGGHVAYSLDGGREQRVAGGSTRVTVADDGEHTLSYSATDAAGNESASRSVSFKLDTTPPGDVSLADPDRWLNASEAGGYEQLVTLADPDAAPRSGLSGYSVTTDGSFPDETVDVAGSRIKLDPLLDGNTVVKARAVSGSGLASAHAAAVTLRVDRTAPEVTLHGAPDAERWEHGAVRLDVEATDALSGMDAGRVEYTVDGGDHVAVPGGTAAIEVGGDGPHTVRYGAVDAAGNRAGERVVSFRIDGGKPGAAQPSSSDGWVNDAGAYVEHVALGDGELVPVSGLAGFSVTTDGSAPDETPEIGSDGVLILGDLPDGLTVVKARAISGAGVASDVVGSGTIKVDRTAPEVVLERPDSEAPRSFVARVSDATSGVGAASVEVRPAGGSEWQATSSELRDGVLRATLSSLSAGQYAVRVVATDVAGNEAVVSRFSDGGSAALSVEPPVETVGGPSPPAAPAPAAPAQPSATKPAARPAPKRCAAKSKRSHRRKHRKASHRRKHAKAHHPACARPHHKGGEKHRRRHLGGKTHKPARRTAG